VKPRKIIARRYIVQTESDIFIVAHAIQQSVAPVFLLTGVGAILSVLSNRLGRVIDRFRLLELLEENKRIEHMAEINILLRRSRWIHWAISLCTSSALLICLVIAVLFIGSELNKDPSTTISILFVTSMVALTAGLLCFLREISLATDNIKIDKK
jgi:hypothetical protein